MLRSQTFALPQISLIRPRVHSLVAREFEHPSHLLDDFCQRHPEVERLELSIYSYKPQTVEDVRRTIEVKSLDLITRFHHEESLLNPDQEIAFHSRVGVRRGLKRELFHIPMIDFGSDINSHDITRLVELSIEFGCDEFDIFNSGRSFHFYGLTLLSPAQWVHFMGRILLLNIPGIAPLVDTRWVGHRLIAGYSSLRWTQNTSHYKQRPQFDRVWDGGTTTRNRRIKNLTSA